MKKYGDAEIKKYENKLGTSRRDNRSWHQTALKLTRYSSLKSLDVREELFNL